MNRVIEILMKRDGLSKEDAYDLVNEVRAEMQDAIACGDYDLAEEIIESDLGLEPDYIIDIF